MGVYGRTLVSASYPFLSLGADTVSNAGTSASLVCFRGYNSSIGDLENQGFNSDGTLNVTGYPVVTLTGQLNTTNNYVLWQNLSFTGALSTPLVGGTAADFWHMVECKIINTQNNASASAVQFDNGCSAINCDFECSGAAHGNVVDPDNDFCLVGCRIKGTEANKTLLIINDQAKVVGNAFIGPGVGFKLASTTRQAVVVGNTFYNLDTGITYPNLAITTLGIVVNNHATDCTKWIDNLYSGTANMALIEVNNRTRDNTTPRTGIGDGANVGEITTDTGGISTDYVDAGNGDFHLIDAAPGQGTGMRALDIGAYKAVDPAGGGGSGGGKQAGSGGGQVG